MEINYEKELTFSINEDKINEIINFVISPDFVINNVRHIVNKVKISPAIHFYFETDNNEKDVYKFKENRGKFILNEVQKANVQESEKFFNIEMTEKTEYFSDKTISFDNIISLIYKERMIIEYRESRFKICFDKVVPVDPIKMIKQGAPYFFCEIEYENSDIPFNEIIDKFDLKFITESKFCIGMMENKVDLNGFIDTVGISNYLDTINSNCYSSFFEKFDAKYFFNNKNIEIELKIKNPENNIRSSILTELEKDFIVEHEGISLIEDEYFDYCNLLLTSNLSYRIRKTNHNKNRNLFFKIPLEDKELFSSRIECMTKFHNYDENEILKSGCYANKMLNNYLNCNISSKLVKVLEVQTSRDIYLIFNKKEKRFLVGVLFFDESKFSCMNKSKVLNEIEFEIFNDSITQPNFMENFLLLNNVFYKYPIDNTNKYINAIKHLNLENS
ncbi:MAG: hypothetical protein WBL93_08230 [Lutisporaceae bacterium]